MSPPSSLFKPTFFSLAAAGLVAAYPGCGRPSGSGPAFATSPELPASARRPDGVVVDPAPELPAPSNSAGTHEPLAVLEPPPSAKAVLAVVSAFFRSIVNEDLDAMAGLLTGDAIAPTRSKSGSQPLLEHWRARMRHLSYRKISGVALYDDAQIEIYRYDDLATLGFGRPSRPPLMIRSDLLARVPIAAARVSNSRFFGDEMLLLLRPENGRLRIREVAEDFQLP